MSLLDHLKLTSTVIEPTKVVEEKKEEVTESVMSELDLELHDLIVNTIQGVLNNSDDADDIADAILDKISLTYDIVPRTNVASRGPTVAQRDNYSANRGIGARGEE